METAEKRDEKAKAAIAAREQRHRDCKRSHRESCRCVMCRMFGCSQQVPCRVCKGMK